MYFITEDKKVNKEWQTVFDYVTLSQSLNYFILIFNGSTLDALHIVITYNGINELMG